MPKPFPKGNKLAGSRKGIPNKRTVQWEVFSEYMLGGGLERFQQELNSLEGEKFVSNMISLMEFFKPKLARAELTGKDGQDLLPKPIMDVVRQDNSNQKNSEFNSKN